MFKNVYFQFQFFCLSGARFKTFKLGITIQSHVSPFIVAVLIICRSYLPANSLFIQTFFTLLIMHFIEVIPSDGDGV